MTSDSKIVDASSERSIRVTLRRDAAGKRPGAHAASRCGATEERHETARLIDESRHAIRSATTRAACCIWFGVLLMGVLPGTARAQGGCSRQCLPPQDSFALSDVLNIDGSMPSRSQLDEWANHLYEGNPLSSALYTDTVAADGTARLLMAFRTGDGCSGTTCLVKGHDVLQWTIVTPGDPDFAGRLISLDGNQSGTSVTDGIDVDCTNIAICTSESATIHWAIYEAPKNYGPEGGYPSRTVDIRIEDLRGYCVEGAIQIRRPPVVLVHGIWSSPAIWEESGFSSALTGKFPGLIQNPVSVLDPGGRFKANASQLRRDVAQAIATMRNATVPGPAECPEWEQNGTAVAQTDLIGHSMGGDLSRLVAVDPKSKKPSNFMKGSVHSITTIHTPHMPAWIAQMIVAGRDAWCSSSSYRCRALKAVVKLAAGESPIDKPCALDDLATVNLPAYDGNAAALVGEFPFDDLIDEAAANLLPKPWGTIYWLLRKTGFIVIPEGDGVVSTESQSGGLTVLPLSPVLHQATLPLFGALRQVGHQQRVIDLYTGDEPFEPGFPATPLSRSVVSAVDFLPRAVGGDLPAPLVVVLTPNDGTVVSPGATVSVSIDRLPGASIGEVLIFSGGEPQIVSVTSLPATVQVTVPDDAAGQFPLVIVSTDPAGDFAEPIEIDLTVAPQVALQSMTVFPPDAWLVRAGDERVLYVFGQYADGVERSITASEAGTTYFSSDPAIVTVSANGRLRAEGFGDATVTVANGGLSVDVPVTVAPDPDDLCGNGVVDAGEDCDPGSETFSCCSPSCELETAGAVCRPAVGACDLPETCDGSSTTCPGDQATSDSDNDGLCDAMDPCTNGAPVVRAKLTMSKLSALPGSRKLSFKGDMTVAHPFTPALDPVTNGVRIVLTDASGATITDAQIPAGAYDAIARTGWRKIGTSKWLYMNPAGSNGITKLQLSDKSTRTPGLIAFSVTGTKGSWAVSNIPVVATIVLDPPTATTGQCGQATFPGPRPLPSCTLSRSGDTLNCK